MAEISLSRLQRFLAGAGLAALLLSGLLGNTYLNNRAQKAELQAQLADLQTQINKINAAGGLTVSGAVEFPSSSPDLELASLVLNSAAASGVTTSPLQAGNHGTAKVGSNTYRTVILNVTVSGTLPQILDFFDRVERGNIKTVAFDNLRVTTTDDGHWTATVQVIAYAQPS